MATVAAGRIFFPQALALGIQLSWPGGDGALYRNSSSENPQIMTFRVIVGLLFWKVIFTTQTIGKKFRSALTRGCIDSYYTNFMPKNFAPRFARTK
jgi:hypothetical protein